MRIHHHNGTVTLTTGRAIPCTYTAAMGIRADMAFDMADTVYILGFDAEYAADPSAGLLEVVGTI